MSGSPEPLPTRLDATPPGAPTTFAGRVRRIARGAGRMLEGERLFDLLGRMTLIVLLLYVDEHHYLTPILMGLALAGLIFTPLLRSPVFWGVIVALLAAFFVYLWHIIDNHMYLTLYWCLAMFLARLADDPLRLLAWNGRLLLGLCFAFATLWKIITPEFLSGAFFHHIILTDWRFQGVATVIVGLSPEALAEQEMIVHDFMSVTSPDEHVTLLAPATLIALAQFMAVWTIMLEGLIALTFLWPRPGRVRLIRHPLLWLFIITTYPIATVHGFAALLVIMALAQTERGRPFIGLVYMVTFVAVPIFSFPTAELARALF